ncbi:RcnB family protein [Phenylobacterium sp.]|jgi:Ni/Co efflux regulator RcnB|uniref:RcnB family protein n=1 Tax=Phenylobacterium sp. TaxID=1871053 RepID=UPI00378452D4
MKKALLITAAAAMTLAGTVASAQPYGYGGYNGRGYYRDSDRDGRPDHREWNRDRDRDGRPDQWDRHDNRRDRYRQGYRSGYGYGGGYGGGYGYGYSPYYGSSSWRAGQVYPYYRDRGYYISDYRAYRLPPPRPGYRYYRSDNGDVVMAAIASGIIGMIIGGALSDNDHGRHRYRY